MADDLRAAGLVVVEHAGWRDRGHGDFRALNGCVWHHDASARGDSPGVPEWLVGEHDAGRPSANTWVALDGTWHLIAAGVTWHAGPVLSPVISNRTSLGTETDHTTGEPWPSEQLDSLRLGTAVLLARTRLNLLEFHRTICDPPGRKTDPDGLDLDTERQAVADALQHSTPTTTKERPTMIVVYAPGCPTALLADGVLTALTTNGEVEALRSAGVPVKGITRGEFQQISSVSARVQSARR